MNIVGDFGVDKTKIVVLGGFRVYETIQDTFHIEHLTIRSLFGDGVFGSISFTAKDVVIEQCGRQGGRSCGQGLVASGSSTVARCTNVIVRKCKLSGVTACNGALIIFDGMDTSIDNNSDHPFGEFEDFVHYGLRFVRPSSTIQLVHPLTKEHVPQTIMMVVHVIGVLQKEVIMV